MEYQQMYAMQFHHKNAGSTRLIVDTLHFIRAGKGFQEPVQFHPARTTSCKAVYTAKLIGAEQSFLLVRVFLGLSKAFHTCDVIAHINQGLGKNDS